MKFNFRFTFAVLVVALVAFSSCTKITPPVIDDLETSFTETTVSGVQHVTISDKGKGTGNITLTSNKVWIIDGLLFVNDGQTLNIQPGTVIKGRAGGGDNASALVVARGGKIMAEGTATLPIIFTSEADGIMPADIASGIITGTLNNSTRGLWGGVIVLGKARLNSSPGVSSIEGIPTNEPRGQYGGTEDNDNSGVIKYISIRHGGSDIGDGNEINGLTLGGVGSGTVIDYVEVIANKDDGVEFFGGTVNTKHMVISFCGDDGFDYDEGYRGNAQFWFIYQSEVGDRGGEHDGGTTPEDGNPYAIPTIYNVTYKGRTTNRLITFRDNAGGHYHNSIFTDYNYGIDIEKLASGEDSYNRLVTGGLTLKNNVFWNVRGNDVNNQILMLDYSDKDANGQPKEKVISHPGIANNVVYNPGFNSLFVPNNNNINLNLAAKPSESFFESASYKGAFDPNNPSNPWFKSWTLLNASGIVK